MNALRTLIIANWKMNPLRSSDACTIAEKIEREAEKCRRTEVVIAPPAVFWQPIGPILRRIRLGAQNVFWESAGPYTGEVSWAQAYEMGVRYVIIGHSERRTVLGETQEMVARKVSAVAGHGMTAVICAGERERQNGDISREVREQVRGALLSIKKTVLKNIVICYEPVWAISTTPGAVSDTPENAFRAAMHVRKIITDMFGARTARVIRVIYGGSVTSKNIASFLKDGGMDGALVGGASLDPEEFGSIIKIADRRKRPNR